MKAAKRQEFAAMRERLFDVFVAQDRIGAAMGEAARWGHVQFLQERLAAGVSVDVETEDGGTPLMFASSGAQPAAIRLLLANGANVNARDRTHGMSPLIRLFAGGSSTKKYVTCSKLLLVAGADPILKAFDGKDASDWAQQRADSDQLLVLLRSFESPRPSRK